MVIFHFTQQTSCLKNVEYKPAFSIALGKNFDKEHFASVSNACEIFTVK